MEYTFFEAHYNPYIDKNDIMIMCGILFEHIVDNTDTKAVEMEFAEPSNDDIL